MKKLSPISVILTISLLFSISILFFFTSKFVRDLEQIDKNSPIVSSMYSRLSWVHVHYYIFIGKDVNAQDSRGWTALMAAADLCSPEHVRYFLDKGANPNLTTTNGDTALMLISSNKTDDAATIAQLLLRHGADPETQNLQGEKAIDKAKRLEDKNLIEALNQ